MFVIKTGKAEVTPGVKEDTSDDTETYMCVTEANVVIREAHPLNPGISSCDME